jgi:hypothetical protein
MEQQQKSGVDEKVPDVQKRSNIYEFGKNSPFV